MKRILIVAIAIFLLAACNVSATNREFESKGIRFSYDRTLATDITVQTSPETITLGAYEGWSKPQHTLLTFTGYTLQYGSRHQQPEIAVYQVEDFKRVNPMFGEKELPGLINILNEKPTTISAPNLPPTLFYPWAYMQVAYLDFQNGSGVRFVVYQRMELVEPIANSNLEYVFLGLTGDGQYYVSAILPVSVAFLPKLPSDENPDLPTPPPTGLSGEERMQTIIAFNEETVHRIEKLKPGDFAPNLKLLDAMIQSLVVK
jgi:hypothetical protein